MPSVECGFKDAQGLTGSGGRMLVSLGPTLKVDIGFDPSFSPSTGTDPQPGIIGVSALVDTGATESCIDSMLAVQLNLPLVDKRMVAGAHGPKEVNVYLAQVRVPDLDFTVYGAFAAVDLQAGGSHHVALIGRTFLRNFTMTYDGKSGTVTIASR